MKKSDCKHDGTRGVARISGRGVLKNFSAAALDAYARARTIVGGVAFVCRTRIRKALQDSLQDT